MSERSYDSMRNALSVHLFLLFLAASVACVDPPSFPAPITDLTELPLPEGAGGAQPHLSLAGNAVILSWLRPAGGGGHELLLRVLDESGWGPLHRVAQGRDWFVNWADFPSVVGGAGETLWAHWLVRGIAGGYDYGVRVAHSGDGGATWSDPWTPHEDDTPTEHGFVSLFPVGEGIGMVWLDGRETAGAAAGGALAGAMGLRYRSATRDGATSDELVVDGRVCECCGTDVIVTAAGPVVAYRNRTQDEVRDVYVSRYVDGAWTEGRRVHHDRWRIGGCPVNGPALAGRGSDLAVAWFTGANDEPRVQVAFSSDAGASFGPAIPVDEGNPAGRVDLVLTDAEAAALVSWVEREAGGEAHVNVRRVESGGRLSPTVTVTRTLDTRSSGFPQMVGDGRGSVVFAWTDVSEGSTRVRVARARVSSR